MFFTMYAVVKFLGESPSQELSVSEVPKSWITEDGSQCWWPPSHSGFYIAQREKPNCDSWKLFDIKVECDCDYPKQSICDISTHVAEPVRPSAKQVEILARPVEVPANCVEKPATLVELPVRALELHARPLELPARPLDLPARPLELPARPLQLPARHPEQSARPLELPARPLELPAQPVELPTNTASQEMPVSTPELSTVKNHDCCSNFDILIDLITELNINVKDLKNTLQNNYTTINNSEAELIMNNLPLQSTDDIIQLEELIQNKKEKDCLMYNLFSIGGKSGEDFTQRLLNKLMSHELAELCTWTGARHTFELRNLVVMDCAYSAISRQFEITREQFEMHVKSWLSLVKQKRKRAV